MDVLALAFVLLPYVFQVGTRYEHKVHIAYHLTGVTHYAAASTGASYIVQLEYLMWCMG